MIPKTLHYITGPKRNDLVDDCINSWQQLKEYGFKIIEWNDSSIFKLLELNYKHVLPAFINARNHAEAADIARYLIVYHYGGFYTDWDVELLNVRKFLTLISNYEDGFLIVDQYNSTFAPEFFCCHPNESFLNNVLNDIISIFNSGQVGELTTPEYTGPFRLRETFAKNKETTLSQIDVKNIFAYDYREMQDPPKKKITQPLIHYWMHSWVNI